MEEYFNRFYISQNPQDVATLDEVEVIFNSTLEERSVAANMSWKFFELIFLTFRFQQADTIFEGKFNGLQELKDSDQSELQQSYLDHLFTSTTFKCLQA